MLLLELRDLVLFLLLELLELALRLVDDLLNFRVNHHLLHLEPHLRLEAEPAELALGLADCDLVVFDSRGRLSHAWTRARLASLIQELHYL